MTTALKDELGDTLLKKGLVPSYYALDLNRALIVPSTIELPSPWGLPSRLFQFPVEISEPVGSKGRRIGLMHPLLADHPFVRHVEAELGLDLDPNGAPNAHGVSQQRTARWWHAVDLVTAGCWRELIETRHFTTDDDIARAVAYGLNYSPAQAKNGNGYLKLRDARAMLGAVGSVEPADRMALLQVFAPPQACRQEGGKEAWPINERRGNDAFTPAWARVIGIECGWFAYDRSGFLGWSALGRDLHGTGPDITFVETSTGQGAFNF